jgi:hypothetical protein
MFKGKGSILLIASSLLLLPVAATAQSDKGAGITQTASKGGTVTAAALIERYKTLAGSPENAKSLVNGLRSKSTVVLAGESTTPEPCIPFPGFPCPDVPAAGVTTTVEFVPPTEAMGFGNVDVALALMEADIKSKKLLKIKPQHIKAALMGESVEDVTFDGILKMRAAGMGWGEIAKSLGFELR